MKFDFKTPAATHVMTGIASLVTGVFVGYMIGKRQQEGDPHDEPIVSVAESDLSPETLAMLAEKRQNGSVIRGARPIKVLSDHPGVPDESVEESSETIEAGVTEVIQRIEVADDDSDATLVNRVTFAQDGPNWDTQAEMATRTPDAPYPIHQDEFFNEESTFRQYSFTYYGMDQILADENDVPIHLPEERIGAYLWGHGSDRPDRFYVRNETMKEEYEITHEPNLYYMVEIRGLELEEVESSIQHSATPKMKPLE